MFCLTNEKNKNSFLKLCSLGIKRERYSQLLYEFYVVLVLPGHALYAQKAFFVKQERQYFKPLHQTYKHMSVGKREAKCVWVCVSMKRGRECVWEREGEIVFVKRERERGGMARCECVFTIKIEVKRTTK